jgi:hypothetical protein
VAVALAAFALAIFLIPGKAESPQAVPQAKRVILPADKQSVGKLLDELARQSGVRVEDQRGEAGPDVQLELPKATFWQALDAIADASGSRISLQPRGGKIALVKGGIIPRTLPISHDGFFRTSVRKLIASHDLESDTVTYTATLEVAWEPGLLPLLLETHPRAPRLLDDKGNALPMRQEGSSLVPVDGQIALTFDVPLPALPRETAKIGLLEGKLAVIAPSKMLEFTFERLDRLDKAGPDGDIRSLTQERVGCRVSKLVLAKDHWTVQISLDYPPGGLTLESYQSWVANNELLLVSPDGAKRLAPAGYVLENSSARRAVLSYHFKDAARGKPEDWKVLYRTPASIVEIPFTFSFKDVRLP